MTKEIVEAVGGRVHPLQKFMAIMDTVAEQFNVAEATGVSNALDELRSAIEKHVLDTSSGGDKKLRMIDMERRKFIAVFKSRYLQLTDLEFTKAVTPADGRLIGQIVALLHDKGFSVNDYLSWCFEVFYTENPKFCPPSIKQACSSFVLDKFWFEHASAIKTRREEATRKDITFDLINRGRALIRARPNSVKWVESIKATLTDFRDGRIMLDELKKRIVKCEGILEKKIQEQALADQETNKAEGENKTEAE